MTENLTRILVAEDSEVQARLLMRDLEAAGYRVSHAANGALALERALEDPPGLVLSDVVMPVLDGFQLCARIRGHADLCHVPVLLLTTLADARDLLKGLEAGADGYVVKPYERDDLLGEIEAALARGPHRDATELAPIEVDYGGDHFSITTGIGDVLRLLTGTYENAIRQNRQLVEAQEATRIAQRELADKLYELEASQRGYRNLLNGSHSGFFRIGRDQRFLEANPALAAMVGMTLDELMALDSAARLFRDPQEFETLLAQQAAGDGVHDFRARLGRADGQDAAVLINGRLVEDGDSTYYVGFVLDVTERDRAEAALRSSEEHFRSIVQLVPDIIYRIDASGNFLFLNDAISELGYSPAELMGQHFSEILAEGELKRVAREHVLPAHEGKTTPDGDAPKLFDERRSGDRRTVGLEVSLRHKQGDAEATGLITPIDCEVSSAGMYVPIPDSDRHRFLGTVGVIRDITVRKRQQREIEELNRDLEHKVEDRTRELYNANSQLERTLKELYNAEEQLIQSEKLSAVGAMVGGVAHEVNNPLMGALNYVQYANEKGTDARLGSYLTKAEEAIKRATKVTASMLSYIREDSPALEAVDVPAAAEAVATMLRHGLYKAGVPLEVELPADLPPAHCTATGLEQILMNLVTNARDALEGEPNGRILLTGEADASSVRIHVSDNGPGIPPDIRRRIFDPFFTTKAPGRGTGLGLAISQRLAQSFGGTLVVAAHDGGGARFTLQIPRGDL